MISKTSHKQPSIPAKKLGLFQSIDAAINTNNQAAKVVYLARAKRWPTDVAQTLNKKPSKLSASDAKSNTKSNKLFRDGVDQLLISLNERRLQLPPELRGQLEYVVAELAEKGFDCTRTDAIKPCLATLVEVERLLESDPSFADADAIEPPTTKPDPAQPARPVQPLPDSAQVPSTPRHTPSNAATRTKATREKVASLVPADTTVPKGSPKESNLNAGLRDRMIGNYY